MFVTKVFVNLIAYEICIVKGVFMTNVFNNGDYPKEYDLMTVKQLETSLFKMKRDMLVVVGHLLSKGLFNPGKSNLKDDHIALLRDHELLSLYIDYRKSKGS